MHNEIRNGEDAGAGEEDAVAQTLEDAGAGEVDAVACRTSRGDEDCCCGVLD